MTESNTECYVLPSCTSAMCPASAFFSYWPTKN